MNKKFEPVEPERINEYINGYEQQSLKVLQMIIFELLSEMKLAAYLTNSTKHGDLQVYLKSYAS